MASAWKCWNGFAALLKVKTFIWYFNVIYVVLSFSRVSASWSDFNSGGNHRSINDGSFPHHGLWFLQAANDADPRQVILGGGRSLHSRQLLPVRDRWLLVVTDVFDPLRVILPGGGCFRNMTDGSAEIFDPRRVIFTGGSCFQSAAGCSWRRRLIFYCLAHGKSARRGQIVHPASGMKVSGFASSLVQ